MCHNCHGLTAEQAQEFHAQPIGPSPVKPVYTKNSFYINDGVLDHDKHPKRNGAYIRNLLNAHNLQCITEMTKWVILAAELVAPFFEAQLVLHRTVAVRRLSMGQLSNLRSPKLRQMLVDALENGEFDRLSDIPSNIEKQMFAENQAAMDQWQAEYEKWAQDKAEADRVSRWQLAQTAQERADLDVEAMVLHHFCDGKLTCRNKTISPDPIVLGNFSGDVEVLEKAVSEVPRLHHVKANHWAGNAERTIHVLGWGRKKVAKLARSTAKDVQATFWAEQWAQVKDAHAELLRQSIENGQRRQQLQARLPRLSNCKGVFAMSMPDIREDFPMYNVLYLHISHFEGSVALAACDFGVLKGTMVLATDIKQLTEFHDVDEGDISMSSPVPRRHPRPPSGPSSPMNAAMKRRHSSAFPERSIDRASFLTANRDSEFPVYFMFRGRDTRNKNTVDYEPREGKMFFQNRDLNVFRGSVDFGLELGTVAFEGFRLPGLPERAPRWDSFSSEVYENEERQREEMDED